MLHKRNNVYKKDIEFNTKKQVESAENTGRQKASFPREYIENAHLYKDALNKIMAIHE